MKKVQEKLIKYEHRCEDDQCIMIWKYDYKKSKNGPVSVDIEWKEFNPNWISLMSKPWQKQYAKLQKIKNE